MHAWELARFVSSILVAAHTLKLNESEAVALCMGSLNAYGRALASGRARAVEAATAEGMVRELLDGIQQRKRKDFLDKRTQKKDGKRQLIPDHKRIAPIREEERSRVESFMKKWAAQQVEPAFFELLDVEHRIAGIGSLGVDRYILLVEGKGSPDQNYLLDLKEAKTSSLQPYLSLPQPHWANQAERIVAIQQRVQDTCPALLLPVVLDDRSYVLRELQPIEDKINLGNWHGKLQRLERMIETMAELIAWGQLRSGGRQGSAIPDDLMAFAHAPNWQEDLLAYAKAYAIQVEADYREFCSNSKF